LFSYFVTSNRFTDLTDISIKDMIFKQKMQEIHDDIVPFGFIDDGSDQIQKITQEESEHPWAIEYDRDL